MKLVVVSMILLIIAAALLGVGESLGDLLLCQLGLAAVVVSFICALRWTPSRKIQAPQEASHGKEVDH